LTRLEHLQWCASRVEPVVRHFAVAESLASYTSIVDLLWTNVAKPSMLDRTSTRLVMKRLLSCPEASIDDSYMRGHFAQQGLGALAEALRTFRTKSQTKCSSRRTAHHARHADLLEALNTSRRVRLPVGPANEAVATLKQLCAANLWPHEALVQVDVVSGWVRREKPW
jgi:hypothetical protein